ncbi:MAG TPA: hypothetical protein VIT91_20510 [Chthoniobacterales bacterium]
MTHFTTIRKHLNLDPRGTVNRLAKQTGVEAKARCGTPRQKGRGARRGWITAESLSLVVVR